MSFSLGLGTENRVSHRMPKGLEDSRARPLKRGLRCPDQFLETVSTDSRTQGETRLVDRFDTAKAD